MYSFINCFALDEIFKNRSTRLDERTLEEDRFFFIQKAYHKLYTNNNNNLSAFEYYA